MGKCLFMRKGETHSAPPKAFANHTWEEIIVVCQTKSVPDAWVVGDSKIMTINGKDYQIDIIGKNHDTYSDGSGTAPLTFQLHDCYGTAYQMNSTDTNSGGWTNCVMRTTTLPAILSLMPVEVQSGIKAVNKSTSAGNMGSNIYTTEDKLFLLSEIELFGFVNRSFDGEGSHYAYYAAGNPVYKSAPSDSEFDGYWERSPYYGDKKSFCAEMAWTDNAYYATKKIGVSFAFCF